MIERHASREIESLLGQFRAVVLTGARQMGKTTLARKIAALRPSVCFDLDDDEARSALQVNTVRQLCQHDGKLIVIDEVQKVPDIFRAIRAAIDRMEQNVPGRFLLLGSTCGQLLRQSGENLFGRKAEFELSGLNCLEVGADAASIARLWDRGGYPLSYLAASDAQSRRERDQMLKSLLRDNLASIDSGVDPISLKNLFYALARSHGSPAGGSNLADQIGTSPMSVVRHLRMLEEMMIIRRLPAFARAAGSSLVKRPKYYIRDSGLLHALWGVSPNDGTRLAAGSRGASWEGFVIENLIAVMPSSWQASFYRSRKGQAEIDLVLQLPGDQIWAIEIRSGENAGNIALSAGNRKALDRLQPQRSFVVYGGGGCDLLPGNIEVVSLAAMMNEIQAQQYSTAARGPSRIDSGSSSLLAALVAAMKTAQPNVALLRNEFIDGCTKSLRPIFQTSRGADDAAARRDYMQVRNEVVGWLQLACQLDEANPARCSPPTARTLHKLLARVLEYKLTRSISGSGLTFTDLAVCDLFAHIVALLLESGKFASVNSLLTQGYVVAGALHDYRRFYYQQPPSGMMCSVSPAQRLPADEAADELWQLVSASKVNLEWLLAAEQIVFLFGIDALINANGNQQSEGTTILPRIMECVPAERLQPLELFLHLPTREGQQNLAECIGGDKPFPLHLLGKMAGKRMGELLAGGAGGGSLADWSRLVALDNWPGNDCKAAL